MAVGDIDHRLRQIRRDHLKRMVEIHENDMIRKRECAAHAIEQLENAEFELQGAKDRLALFKLQGKLQKSE